MYCNSSHSLGGAVVEGHAHFTLDHQIVDILEYVLNKPKTYCGPLQTPTAGMATHSRCHLALVCSPSEAHGRRRQHWQALEYASARTPPCHGLAETRQERKYPAPHARYSIHVLDAPSCLTPPAKRQFPPFARPTLNPYITIMLACFVSAIKSPQTIAMLEWCIPQWTVSCQQHNAGAKVCASWITRLSTKH